MLDSLCREPSRCPFAPSSAKRRTHSPGHRLSARKSALPFRANDYRERGENHSLHARNRANIPASPYGLGDLERMEHAKLANGSGHELPIGRSPSSAEQDQKDAARSAGKKAARKKAARERPSRHGRSGRRWAASRNQTNWFAAIAGAMTWLRVSSSGEIADAASVLVNAMDHGLHPNFQPIISRVRRFFRPLRAVAFPVFLAPRTRSASRRRDCHVVAGDCNRDAMPRWFRVPRRA